MSTYVSDCCNVQVEIKGNPKALGSRSLYICDRCGMYCKVILKKEIQ